MRGNGSVATRLRAVNLPSYQRHARARCLLSPKARPSSHRVRIRSAGIPSHHQASKEPLLLACGREQFAGKHPPTRMIASCGPGGNPSRRSTAGSENPSCRCRWVGGAGLFAWHGFSTGQGLWHARIRLEDGRWCARAGVAMLGKSTVCIPAQKIGDPTLLENIGVAVPAS